MNTQISSKIAPQYMHRFSSPCCTFGKNKFYNFYMWASWSLTLRDERRLIVFENMVLRGIFGAKRDEVTEEWIKLHDNFNNLYC